VGSHSGAAHLASAISHPDGCHQSARAETSRQPIRDTGAPPKQDAGISPGRHGWFVVPAPLAPLRQERSR